MKTTAKRLWTFSSLDYKAAERYLEKMAAKGFLLQEIDDRYNIMAYFEKREPQEVHYCIDGISGTDEEKAVYLQLAGDSGWHLMTYLNGQAVFVSEPGRNPVPIQTDWQEEYRQIRKGLWKRDIPNGMGFIFVLWLFSWLSGDFLESIIMERKVLFAAMAVGIAASIALFLRAVWFYARSEIAIRTERPMKTDSHLAGQLWRGTHVVLAVAAFVMIAEMTIFVVRLAWEEGINLVSILAVAAVITMMLLNFPSIRRRIGESRAKKLSTGILIGALAAFFVQCAAANL